MVVLPTSGGEYTNTENMEALYASIPSWVRKKMTTYLSHPERELMSTGTLLNPHHYKPTLKL